MYLAGETSFQGVPTQVSVFNGQPSAKLSLKAMSVLEALIARRQKPTGPDDRQTLRRRLKRGRLGSITLGLLTWDSLRSCKGIPYAKLHIGLAVWRLCQSRQEWTSGDHVAICRNLYRLVRQNSQVLAYDSERISRSGLKGEESYKRLGWTWLLGGTAGSLEQSGGVGLWVGERLFHGERFWDEWTPRGPIHRSVAVHSREGMLLLLPHALQASLDWLAEPELFQRCTVNERDEIRFVLSHQLHEVRTWLVVKRLFTLLAEKPSDRSLAFISRW